MIDNQISLPKQYLPERKEPWAFRDAPPTVIVDNVSVVYKTPGGTADQIRQTSVKQKLEKFFLGREPLFPVTAVSDVSFAAYEGDSIGLIGPNGAGKSTLLRIIAGAESPASGRIWAKSQPILQGVSAALLPQLSGIENARLGCLAMGMSPSEADRAVPDIIDFSSLGPAIYRPMETYSSGMAARLRFAISTAVKPEILLIDEALSTGDASFQQKSSERMDSVLEKAGTLFVVSHSLQAIRKLCNRAIWIWNGSIVADGPPDELARRYANWARASVAGEAEIMEYVARSARRDYPPQVIETRN